MVVLVAPDVVFAGDTGVLGGHLVPLGISVTLREGSVAVRVVLSSSECIGAKGATALMT